MPTNSVSYRTTRPRRNGSFAQREPWKPRVEALGGVDDPAVGMAKGDRDRVAAAHQDALDQGLAAVRVARHCREVYRLAPDRAAVASDLVAVASQPTRRLAAST